MQCYNCNAKSLVYNVENDSYICKKCGYEYPKQYFFISHSHLDIEKVRLIRNTIEDTFFYEPILFFLKCISNDNELQDLLQREISERIWFVYCKSENASNSKYVQKERAYVNQLIKNGKKINLIEIELDKFDIWNNKIKQYINNQIAFQIKKTKLFICSSIKDRNIFYIFQLLFQKAGYSVWNATKHLTEDILYNLHDNYIKKHSYKDGLILFLVSYQALSNDFVLQEIEEALIQNAMILPILISENSETDNILMNRLYEKFLALRDKQIFILRENFLNEDIDKLINVIKQL